MKTPLASFHRRLPLQGHQRRCRNTTKARYEKTVAEIFVEVLRITQVSRHDNFFALGGDSLRALQVLIRVQEAFQIELSPQVLSAAPTIAGMALAVLKKQSEAIEDGDDFLTNLEQLSEEEAVRSLAEIAPD